MISIERRKITVSQPLARGKRSPRRQRQLFILWCTLVLYIYLILACVRTGGLSWTTAVLVLAALYLADAGSGVAHFVVDFTPNVRGAGLRELIDYPGRKASREYIARRERIMRQLSGFQEVVFDFKVHHVTPAALGKRSLLTMTLPVIVYALFPLTAMLVILQVLGWMPPAALLFSAVLLGAATVAQYSHACAHKAEPAAWIVALQRMRLFLPPSAHDVHHRDPERHFCLLNGWANPVVNQLFRWVLKGGYLRRENLPVR